MDIDKGTYLIDKPRGWTSFDCVAKIRSELLKKANPPTLNSYGRAGSQEQIANSLRLRVGHTGTLDPFATGLLIILVGPATKKQTNYMKLDKEYEAILFLGATSTTGDPEGVISKKLNVHKIYKEEIKHALKQFTGVIEQVPPQYSAIKVKGKPAYKLARAGQKVNLKPRKITVYNIEILDYKWPKLKLKVNCSSGTYIRTLAEDIGRVLGCGAYLTSLNRTKIGNLSLEKAKKLEELLS
jgi:tRNA pseudouridine55 synthase